MSFRPLNDNILIKVDDLYTMTKGIYIPDNVWGDKEPQMAEVLAVGPKVKNCAPGDRVIIIKFAGKEQAHPDYGPGSRVVKSAEILAKVLNG